MPLCSKWTNDLIQNNDSDFAKLNTLSSFAPQNFPCDAKQSINTIKGRLLIPMFSRERLSHYTSEHFYI